MPTLIFTAPDCENCRIVKESLTDYVERDAADLQGCSDWRELVAIRAELELKNWSGEVPVLVIDGKVTFMKDCSDGSCKI